MLTESVGAGQQIERSGGDPTDQSLGPRLGFQIGLTAEYGGQIIKLKIRDVNI
jgi:hypothetical protein